MLDLTADLDRLDELLSALPLEAEAMLLSELDGFLAGLLILPEPADEAEWLPHIWKHCPLDEGEQKIADEIATLARMRKTEIALQFRQGDGSYDPVFEPDTDGSLFWEVWFEGYERAVGLQDHIYDRLIDHGGEDMRRTIAGLVWVALAAHRKLDIPRNRLNYQELHDFVPEFLTSLIENLFRLRHGLPVELTPIPTAQDFAMEPRRSAKVGRNEPCPCGSGKKYKKCCGG